MVIGLLVIAGIPTTIGVCEALNAQKKQDAAAKEKARFHLTTTVVLDDQGPVECFCVLKDGKLWIDHPAFPVPGGHKFLGYYFTYPSEAQHLGLVSSISDEVPMLNWIFADKDSKVVRHGGRQDTLGGHVIGPWHWTDDEQWLTLDGDDSQFVSVQMENRNWAIVWDRDRSIRDSPNRGAGTILGGNQGEKCEKGDKDDGGGMRVNTGDRGEAKGGEEEEGGEPSGSSGGAEGKGKHEVWLPIRLRRKMQLGMESRYVKGEGK